MLAFIGGTGPEGVGLALRFLLAGEDIVIGSRSAERATAAADKLREMVSSVSNRGTSPGKPQGMENQQAVQGASLVLITVPFSGQAEILETLRDAIGDKLVVDTVVPLKFTKASISAVPVAEGSAAQQAQKILPRATVIAAFQNLSAETLMDPREEVDSSVVVCGDNVEAKAKVMKLAEKISGIRAVDGGPLANSRYVEDFTALLLNINRIYKAHSSIKITGLKPSSIP